MSDHLLALLIDLDARRAHHKQAAQEIDELEARVIQEMRAARIDSFDLPTDRRALLERPVRRAINAELFRRACLAAGIGERRYSIAIKQTVLAGEAERLIGGDALDRIATRTSGKPCIRFVSAARGGKGRR